MPNSINGHIEMPPVFREEAVNAKFKNVPKDVLLAVAFLHKDFTSMRNQQMTCCVIYLNDELNGLFQKFNVEGMAIPEKRRHISLCAMVIMNLARAIIDTKICNSPSDMIRVQWQRAEVPGVIENSVDHARKSGIKITDNSLFVGFSAIEYVTILNEFAPLFESQ